MLSLAVIRPCLLPHRPPLISLFLGISLQIKALSALRRGRACSLTAVPPLNRRGSGVWAREAWVDKDKMHRVSVKEGVEAEEGSRGKEYEQSNMVSESQVRVCACVCLQCRSLSCLSIVNQRHLILYSFSCLSNANRQDIVFPEVCHSLSMIVWKHNI